MATPTSCTIYTTTAIFHPWDESLPYQESSQIFGSETGPHASQCPGQIRPFTPSLEAGTANPTAGAFSAFTLMLNREDGNQYLGKLKFTMPPGLTANLHGVSYCPEASIAAAASTRAKSSRPTRAVRPPQKSAAQTSPPVPEPTLFTRSARSTWPGHSKARHCRWWQ